MRYSSIFVIPLALFVASITPAQAQIDGDFLEDVRDSVREAFDPSRAGIFYAASINFAVQPDIATGSFFLDGIEDSGATDPELFNTRLPLRYTFDTRSDDLRAFIQGSIGYQDLSMGLPLLDEDVEVDWRSRGINVSAGVEYRLTERWKLLPSVNLGVADLRNKADYGDSILGPIFQPVFEGILFDWDTRAWIAGASIGARYERAFERFRLLANMTASGNHIRSFDESSPDVTIRDSASTLDVAFNTIHPLGRLGDTNVDLVTVLGATSLVGNARGELGFDEFAEVGLALQFDVQGFGGLIDGLRIGAKAILGEEVSGWTVIIGQGI